MQGMFCCFVFFIRNNRPKREQCILYHCSVFLYRCSVFALLFFFPHNGMTGTTWNSVFCTGAGQNIPGQNIPCHFLPPRTKHPTKICHPGQNIPCSFCHPGHNIPCCFCHPGHNIPCHFCHPGQNIPH